MADGPAAGEHPVRGHDHVRRLGPRDPLAIPDVLDDVLVRVVERRVAAPEQRGGLLVVRLRVARGRPRTRTSPSASRGTAGAPGSGRPSRRRSSAHTISWVRPMANDGISSTPFCATSRSRPRPACRSPPPRRSCSRPPYVDSHEDDVAVGDGGRVADDRRAGPAEVAREHDDRVAPAAGPRESRIRTIAEPRMWPASSSVTWTPWRDLVLRAVRDRSGTSAASASTSSSVYSGSTQAQLDARAGLAQQLLGVGAARALGAVGRQLAATSSNALLVAGGARRPPGRGRAAPGGSPAWRTPPGAWPSPAARAAASSAVAAVHTIAPAEALLDQQRQQPAVVEVGVGEDDRVERRRVNAQRHPVAHRLVGAALEHAAVDEDPRPAGVDEVARARDGPRPAEEGELHASIVTHAARRARPCARCGLTPATASPRSRPRYLARARSARPARRRARSGEPADASALEARRALPSSPARRSRRDAGGSARGDEGDRPTRREPSAARTRGPSRRSGAGIETAFGADAELPVAPVVDAGGCDDDAAWDAAIEGRRHGAPGAARGLLRLRRGRPRGRRRTPAPAAGPRPAGDGAGSRRRRRLFLALEPLWRAVDGDGGGASPYRALIRESRARVVRRPLPHRRQRARARARGGRGRGLGVGDPRRLARRRGGAGRAPRRAADRALGLVVAGRRGRSRAGARRSRSTARRRQPRVHAALGADVEALGIRFDVDAAPGRPPLPVAFTTFGGAAASPTPTARGDPGRADGVRATTRRRPGRPQRARPRDRPRDPHRRDPDPARRSPTGRTPTRSPRPSPSVVALDAGEPAWHARWIAGAAAIPDASSIRCATRRSRSTPRGPCSRSGCSPDPTRRPNDVWTEITSELAGRRPAPGVVVVGDPRPARPGAGLHGELRRRRRARGRPPGRDPRGARRLARTATPAGTRGSRSASTGSGRSGRQATCCETCSGRPPNAAAVLADIARARSVA